MIFSQDLMIRDGPLIEFQCFFFAKFIRGAILFDYAILVANIPLLLMNTLLTVMACITYVC